MRAPNDPNPPPPEFVLSPSPTGSPPGRPCSKPPLLPFVAAQGVQRASARGEREGPDRTENGARREEPCGFGAQARKLLGREPTAPELEELLRVRDALGLRDNDALWLVLMSLQHLRREFEASIDRRLAETRQTTDAIVESAKAQFLRDFPAALKVAARKVVVKALGFNGPVVLSGPVAGMALVVASLGVVGVGWLAYDLGKSAGYEQGVLAHKAATPPAPKPPAPPSAKGR